MKTFVGIYFPGVKTSWKLIVDPWKKWECFLSNSSLILKLVHSFMFRLSNEFWRQKKNIRFFISTQEDERGFNSKGKKCFLFKCFRSSCIIWNCRDSYCFRFVSQKKSTNKQSWIIVCRQNFSTKMPCSHHYLLKWKSWLCCHLVSHIINQQPTSDLN